MRKTKSTTSKDNFFLVVLIFVTVVYFLENKEGDLADLLVLIAVAFLFWFWRWGMKNKRFYLEAGNLVVAKFFKKSSLRV